MKDRAASPKHSVQGNRTPEGPTGAKATKRRLMGLAAFACIFAGTSVLHADNTVATTVSDMTALFASDGFIYWKEGGGNLYRGCIDSAGSLTTVTSACGADGGVIYSDFAPKYTGAAAASAGFVYWMESGTTDLRYGSIDLGASGELSAIVTVSTSIDIAVLAADRGWLYWIEKNGSTIQMGKIEEDASGAYALVDMGTIKTGVDDTYQLAADRGWLFFKDLGASTLYKGRPNLLDQTIDNAAPVSTSASGYDLIAAEGGSFYYRNSGNDLYKSTSTAVTTAEYDWKYYVESSFDTLIDYGTDKYGTTHTNLFMSNLDLAALAAQTPPYSPSYHQIIADGWIDDLDAPIRAEEYGRIYSGRIAWSGSNIAHDYPLLQAMYLHQGSSENATKYADAANDYIVDQFKYAAQHTSGSDDHSADGLFYAGNHTYYNAYSDSLGRPKHTNELTVRKTVEADVEDIAFTDNAGDGTNHFYFIEGDSLKHGNIEQGALVNVTTIEATGWSNYKISAFGPWFYHHNVSSSDMYRIMMASDGTFVGSSQLLANDMPTSAFAAFDNKFYWVENGNMYRADSDPSVASLTNVTLIQPSSMAVAIAAGGNNSVLWIDSGATTINRGHVDPVTNLLVLDHVDDRYTTGTDVLESSGYDIFWNDGGVVYDTSYDEINREYVVLSDDPNVKILAADGQSPPLQYWAYTGDPVGKYRYGNTYPAGNHFWVGSATAERVIADMAATESGKLLWIEGNTLYSGGSISNNILSGTQSSIADATHVGASTNYAYWTTTTNLLKRQPLDSSGTLTGSPETMEDGFTATALAAEDEYIYWKTSAGALVQGRVQLTDTGPRLVTLGVFDARSSTVDIAVKRDIVYWNDDGKLLYWGIGRMTDMQQHEFNSTQFTPWDQLWAVNSIRTRAYIDGLWKTHVYDPNRNDQDPLSGSCLHNRHSYEEESHPNHMFTQTAGNMISGFALMASHTTGAEQTRYLDKAKCILSRHTMHREDETASPRPILMASEASYFWAPPLERWDMENMATDTFQLAVGLFKAYEYSGDAAFYTEGVNGIIKAYNAYGWNESAQTYYGMLDVFTGNPITDKTVLSYAGTDIAYRDYAPTKNINMWRTLSASYEFGLLAAQASLMGYEISRDHSAIGEDTTLLPVVDRWKKAIERNLPVRPGKRFGDNYDAPEPGELAGSGVWGDDAVYVAGSYAENYARLISFYVHLHDVYNRSGKDPLGQGREYLQRAISLGHEAIDKLWVPLALLFRDHPMSAYYQASGGVGQLLHALLELEEATDNDSDPIPSMF